MFAALKNNTSQCSKHATEGYDLSHIERETQASDWVKHSTYAVFVHACEASDGDYLFDVLRAIFLIIQFLQVGFPLKWYNCD